MYLRAHAQMLSYVCVNFFVKLRQLTTDSQLLLKLDAILFQGKRSESCETLRDIQGENWLQIWCLSIFWIACSKFASVTYRSFRRLYQVVQMIIKCFQCHFKVVAFVGRISRSIYIHSVWNIGRHAQIWVGWACAWNICSLTKLQLPGEELLFKIAQGIMHYGNILVWTLHGCDFNRTF